RGGPRAAIGLDDVAVDQDLALAERRQVDHGAERAADETLDFLGTAGLLALRCLPLHALGGRARQHAIFGGDPTLAPAAQPGRHAFLEARGAVDMGLAETHEA